jgi:lipoic acid synthetase
VTKEPRAREDHRDLALVRRLDHLGVAHRSAGLDDRGHARFGRVIDASLNHNLETVPDLYPQVRPEADYQRSLELLRRAAAFGLTSKTGLMLGLGETEVQVQAVLDDLIGVNCRRLTLGQYLRPSPQHYPVVRWVHPEEFAAWAAKGKEMGFDHVEAGPLVRSSYHAGEQVEKII